MSRLRKAKVFPLETEVIWTDLEPVNGATVVQCSQVVPLIWSMNGIEAMSAVHAPIRDLAGLFLNSKAGRCA